MSCVESCHARPRASAVSAFRSQGGECAEEPRKICVRIGPYVTRAGAAESRHSGDAAAAAKFRPPVCGPNPRVTCYSARGVYGRGPAWLTPSRWTGW
ncbi:hypothetical protein NDU88_001415 [Pleurodeles waltl]|uniref:Uncharacterized protein n=1 Tax=Pleurodeles waltl TaxID=8319 RepID=A0AAV7MND4_PLEWA|nr:hypothetical protein NDU88_001415 [Pleurodeles waltl]